MELDKKRYQVALKIQVVTHQQINTIQAQPYSIHVRTS